MHKDSPVTKRYLSHQRKTYALFSVLCAAFAALTVWLGNGNGIATIFVLCIPALWLFYAHTVRRINQGTFGTKALERADVDRWLEHNGARRQSGISLD